MTSRLFSSILMTAILMVLALTLVSAVTITQTTSTYNFTSTINEDLTSVTFSPTTMTEGTYTYTFPTVTPSGDNAFFTIAPTFTDLILGQVYSTTATLTNTTAVTNETVTLNILKTFCEQGNMNDTDLEFTIDISNKGEGEDYDWLPLDTIEIEVDFDNNYDTDDEDYDLDDIIIKLGLIDSSGNDVADDLLWISSDDEEADVNDVDEGDSAKHTFEFKVDNEIDDGTYKVVVKVYPDNDEDQICIDYESEDNAYYTEITVDRESDDDRLVFFDDIELSEDIVPCGAQLTLTADAYNLGDTDQEMVLVKLYNVELGIEEYTILEDLDANDDEAKIDFTFEIPANATEGSHSLILKAFYDWDDEEDEENEFSYDEASDPQRVTLAIKDNCIGSIRNVEITAALSEDTPKALSGEELIIETTIENTGDTEVTYTISVSGVSSWADATIEDNEITLKAGESEVIEIVLDIDNDAEVGEQEFTIKTTYGSESSEQKVLIEVEESGFFAGSSILGHLKDNSFIYIVVIVDLILIIAIIIAVRRMVIKRPSA